MALNFICFMETVIGEDHTHLVILRGGLNSMYMLFKDMPQRPGAHPLTNSTRHSVNIYLCVLMAQ